LSEEKKKKKHAHFVPCAGPLQKKNKREKDVCFAVLVSRLSWSVAVEWIDAAVQYCLLCNA